jgi:hypothetical protein
MHKKTSGLPFALNLFLGFGIGSFVQGDIGSGVTMLLLEIGGISLMTANLAAFLGAVENSDSQRIEIASGLMYAGRLLFFSSRIAGLIRPFTFSKKYNNKLKQALNYYTISFNFGPAIDITGNAVFLAGLRYQF